MKYIRYAEYKNLNKDQLIDFIIKNKIDIDYKKYTDKKTANGIRSDIFNFFKNNQNQEKEKVKENSILEIIKILTNEKILINIDFEKINKNISLIDNWKKIDGKWFNFYGIELIEKDWFNFNFDNKKVKFIKKTVEGHWANEFNLKSYEFTYLIFEFNNIKIKLMVELNSNWSEWVSSKFGSKSYRGH